MSVSQDELDYYRVQTMLMNADDLDKNIMDVNSSSHSLSLALSLQEKLKERSDKIINFVESETDFVQELQTFISVFYNPF